MPFTRFSDVQLLTYPRQRREGTEPRLTYRWNIIIVKASAVASRRFLDNPWMSCASTWERQPPRRGLRTESIIHSLPYPFHSSTTSFPFDTSQPPRCYTRYSTLLITCPTFLCRFFLRTNMERYVRITKNLSFSLVRKEKKFLSFRSDSDAFSNIKFHLSGVKIFKSCISCIFRDIFSN